jgi:hypothetical protein
MSPGHPFAGANQMQLIIVRLMRKNHPPATDRTDEVIQLPLIQIVGHAALFRQKTGDKISRSLTLVNDLEDFF